MRRCRLFVCQSHQVHKADSLYHLSPDSIPNRPEGCRFDSVDAAQTPPAPRAAARAVPDGAALADYDEHKGASLMERNPMRFWSGKTKGFAQFDGDRFGFRLDVPDGMAKTLYAWMREVCARCARGVRVSAARVFERKRQRQ